MPQSERCIFPQFDLDQEKFFDRLITELQLLPFHIAGFPDMGYMEWLAESLSGTIIITSTPVGKVECFFCCGTRQGATLSTITANMVGWHISIPWDTPHPTLNISAPGHVLQATNGQPLYDEQSLIHLLWVHSFKFSSRIIRSISLAHRRRDSGCPCNAFLTRNTMFNLHFLPGYFFSYQSLNCWSTLTYRGATGAGASAKALDGSALITTKLSMAALAQNILDPVWSNALAYVCASVTDPLMFFEPLHTQWALCVPSSLMRYTQISESKLAPFGKYCGSPKVSWASYWSSCFSSDCKNFVIISLSLLLIIFVLVSLFCCFKVFVGHSAFVLILNCLCIFLGHQGSWW